MTEAEQNDGAAIKSPLTGLLGRLDQSLEREQVRVQERQREETNQAAQRAAADQEAAKQADETLKQERQSQDQPRKLHEIAEVLPDEAVRVAETLDRHGIQTETIQGDRTSQTERLQTEMQSLRDSIRPDFQALTEIEISQLLTQLDEEVSKRLASSGLAHLPEDAAAEVAQLRQALSQARGNQARIQEINRQITEINSPLVEYAHDLQTTQHEFDQNMEITKLEEEQHLIGIVVDTILTAEERQNPVSERRQFLEDVTKDFIHSALSAEGITSIRDPRAARLIHDIRTGIASKNYWHEAVRDVSRGEVNSRHFANRMNEQKGVFLRELLCPQDTHNQPENTIDALVASNQEVYRALPINGWEQRISLPLAFDTLHHPEKNPSVQNLGHQEILTYLKPLEKYLAMTEASAKVGSDAVLSRQHGQQEMVRSLKAYGFDYQPGHGLIPRESSADDRAYREALYQKRVSQFEISLQEQRVRANKQDTEKNTARQAELRHKIQTLEERIASIDQQEADRSLIEAGIVEKEEAINLAESALKALNNEIAQLETRLDPENHDKPGLFERTRLQGRLRKAKSDPTREVLSTKIRDLTIELRDAEESLKVSLERSGNASSHPKSELELDLDRFRRELAELG